MLHAARVARRAWNLAEAQSRFEQALRLLSEHPASEDVRPTEAALGLVDVALARDESELARATLGPLLERAEASNDSVALARGVRDLAILELRAGAYDSGLVQARRAVEAAQSAELPDLARHCHMVEGRLLEHLRRHDEARRVYEPILAELHGAGSSELARCQFRVASLEIRDGRTDQARALLSESARIHEANGDRLEVMRCLHNQALVELLSGDPTRALPLIERALSEAADLGSGWVAQNCERLRGDILTRLDQTDAALEAYGRGIEIAESAGHRDGLVHGLNNRAWSLLYAGRAGEGEDSARQGLELAEAMGNEPMTLSCRLALGEALRQHGDTDAAVAMLEGALAQADAAELTLSAVTDGLAGLGRAYLSQGRPTDASVPLRRAATAMIGQGREREAQALQALLAP